jgi:hypothetical protein
MARVRTRRPAGRLVALLACAALPWVASGCRDNVDVQQSLQVTNVVTGWFDAGIVGGKNKLVPTVSFQVKNTAAQPVRFVQLNAVFRVIGDKEELGSMFVKGIGGDGLAPGASSEVYVLRSALGYTGEQPRHEMLQHGQFRDAKVEIFAKHGSEQWVKLGEYGVARQLLTQ